MFDTTAFFQELDRRRAALAQMRRDVELKEAELRGMEHAARFMVPSEQTTVVVEEASGEIDSKREGMRISQKWRVVLMQLASAYPSDLPLDEIKRNAMAAGADVNENTLRAQMATYANAGYVERMRAGRFRLTQSGADAIGYPFNLADRMNGMSPQQMRDTGIIPQHAVVVGESQTALIPLENSAVLTETNNANMEDAE